MITHHIPLISPTAGDLSDGSILGEVSQSNPTAVLMGESLVQIAAAGGAGGRVVGDLYRSGADPDMLYVVH